jgi:beta-lactamase superfamily II metal-dependent hydrolase
MMDIRNKKSLFKLILGILLLTNCNIFAQNTVNKTSLTWKEGYLDIHHINTGRGVASFCILPDGTTMLIDAGDIDDTLSRKSLPLTVTPPYPDNSKTAGEWIADYINQVLPVGQQNVIDYALITHFHGDHYGVITNKTPIARNGAYKLSGITEVGNLLPIKMLIDRNYPAYNFPTELEKAYQVEPSNFLNLQKFINYQQTSKGMLAASLKIGVTNQIVLKKNAQKYPEFKVRGVKANGTIWTGKDDETFEFFTADSVLDAKGKFNENPLSLAIKMSYGKFDYFTGGDNTGLQGYGLPAWFDVETPIAKAVGKVEVSTLNHHGNRDGTNEFFLKTLQPNVVVEQTWCSDHPGQEVMHRLISDHLYKGEKNIFATNIQEVTKQTLGFWFTRGYKSMFGHVIIRVQPGGNEYYVLIAETLEGKLQIMKSFGPYFSN